MRRVALGALVTIAVSLVTIAVWLVGASVAYGNTVWATCTAGGQGQTCDSTVWYPGALTVVWHASPTPDSTSGCGLEINYHYNGDQITNVACSATWAGPGPGTTTVTEPYMLHVETSSPSATVGPNRGPDSGGWYNHPVTAAFSASSFSGIASCTPTTYAGPSTLSATVSGTCVDNAGKTVTASSAPFAFDTTHPSLAVGAAPSDRSVMLSWQTGGDVAPTASVTITRSPAGTQAAAADTVYSGTATTFLDTHLRDGVRYLYTFTAIDQAGNQSAQRITVVPGARLLAPIENARLSSPPLLSWTPVIGASYYNVQLYRGHKLLSTWPSTPSLQLRPSWRFRGHRYGLKPGKYQWFVWPGFGRRSRAKYGHEIGSGTFFVVR